MADFDVVLSTEVNEITAEVTVENKVFDVTVQVGGMGPQGFPGETVINYTAGADISGHRCVMLGSDEKAVYASCSDISSIRRIIGITNNAAVTDDVLVVRKFGVMTEPTWNWDINKPVYLGIDGALIQTPEVWPTSLFTIILGYPISATKMLVNISTPILLTGE